MSIEKKKDNGNTIPGVFIKTVSIESDFTLRELDDQIGGLKLEKIEIQGQIDELEAMKVEVEAL